MSNEAGREILIAGARALAHADGLGPTLEDLITAIATRLEIGSAAIFVVDRQTDRLEIVASSGLGDSAVAGLAAAVADPNHPIAITFATPVASFNVQPIAPGGPRLRSHLPLVVTRGGSDVVLGVLALAHDDPIDPASQPLLEAGANLAAVAIERGHEG